MHAVFPKAIPIASSAVDRARLQEYLDDIGATEYESDATTSIDALIEAAGKQCYKSWQAHLNPNVTKVRKENADYLDNINKQSHGSVREHGSITFVFWDVSRVFTHELVRHRAGTAMSQESLRFVRLTDLGFWIPTILKEHDNAEGEGQKLLTATVEYLEYVQKELTRIYKIEESKNFDLKKKLTSGFRRVAPIGLATSIIWTGNVSALRHCIQQRTSRHAEEEIRIVFDMVAKFCVDIAPNIFADLRCREVDGIGEWWSTNAAMPYDQAHLQELLKAIKPVVRAALDNAPNGWTPEMATLYDTLQYWGHLEPAA